MLLLVSNVEMACETRTYQMVVEVSFVVRAMPGVTSKTSIQAIEVAQCFAEAWMTAPENGIADGRYTLLIEIGEQLCLGT